MASIQAKEIPEESRFMTDFWNFRKKFYLPESTDEYWQELVNAADDLSQKYGNKKYYRDLIIACCTDIDKRYREERGRVYE